MQFPKTRTRAVRVFFFGAESLTLSRLCIDTCAYFCAGTWIHPIAKTPNLRHNNGLP